MNKEQAYQHAKDIADNQAAPCLIMCQGTEYRVGLRTDKTVRLFGKHVATAHRYGVIAQDDCLVPLGDIDRKCLCQ